MTSPLIKTVAAAALVLAGGLAHAGFALPAEPITLTASADASTLLGGTAMTSLTLSVLGSYALGGGSLSLSFADTALAFVPDSSSVGGVPFAGLAALLGAGATVGFGPGTATLDGALPQPVDIGDGSLTFGLAFRGLSVGPQSVNYVLSLVDDNGDATSFKGTLGVNVSAVPEPAQGALMLAGLAAIGLMARRRGIPR